MNYKERKLLETLNVNYCDRLPHDCFWKVIQATDGMAEVKIMRKKYTLGLFISKKEVESGYILYESKYDIQHTALSMLNTAGL